MYKGCTCRENQQAVIQVLTHAYQIPLQEVPSQELKRLWCFILVFQASSLGSSFTHLFILDVLLRYAGQMNAQAPEAWMRVS